jgi:hypothetical protein
MVRQPKRLIMYVFIDITLTDKKLYAAIPSPGGPVMAGKNDVRFVGKKIYRFIYES